MVSFIYILALLSTTFALIIGRNVPPVPQPFQTIENALNAFTRDMKNWDGTAGGAVTIQSDERAVDNAFKSTIQQLQVATPLSTADQQRFASDFTGTLEPDFEAAINTMISRKDAFAKAGLTVLARSDLSNLYDDMNALCGALFRIAGAQAISAYRSSCQRAYNTVSKAVGVFS